MSVDPFIEGIEVLEVIEQAGHQAFFVGGCVRDYLLRREIGDIDITTSASPEEVQALFPKVIPVGIEHGTVIVRHKHVSYEVTTFRLDGHYSDQRHPDHVEFVTNIDEDLLRRDFTVNAMAMNLSGEILDLFSGKKDLQAEVIRTVGCGFDRFTEDPLRIIRALRFVSQMGFTIEAQTLIAMIQVKEQIATLAVERIKNEMTKFFAGTYVTTGIASLKEAEIDKHLPLFAEHPDFIGRLPEVFTPLHSFGEVIALFHYLDPRISIRQWIKAWKCSNDERNEATAISEALTYYADKGLDQWLAYQLDPVHYAGLTRVLQNISSLPNLRLNELNEVHTALVIKSRQDLKVNGRDLIAIYPQIRRGAWMSDLLSNIEKEVVFERLPNDPSKLKVWLACHPPKDV